MTPTFHNHPAAEFPNSSVGALFRAIVTGEAHQMAVCNLERVRGTRRIGEEEEEEEEDRCLDFGETLNKH